MEAPALRRTLGRVLVVCLSVAAATAIVALLNGSFDDTDWRVIGMSTAFAVSSALAASGATLRRRELPAARPVGTATIGAAAAAFALTLGVLWIPDPSEAFVRGWGVTTIVALALSHASIVLAARRDADPPVVRSLAVASIVLAGIDAGAAALAAAGAVEVSDAGERLVAVGFVLLLLTTALTPLLRRLRGDRPAEAPPAWGASRAGSLERLAAEVTAATQRIERLDVPAEARDECRRLRELTRTLGA